jgi:hypothetical protein
VHHTETTPEQREKGFEDMMKIALELAWKLKRKKGVTLNLKFKILSLMYSPFFIQQYLILIMPR